MKMKQWKSVNGNIVFLYRRLLRFCFRYNQNDKKGMLGENFFQSLLLYRL